MDNIYNAIQNLYNMDKTTWQEVLAELYNLVSNVENKFDLFELKFGSLLGEQVTRELKKMYDNGSLASLINDVLLKDINTKVDTFKTEVSEQLDNIVLEGNVTLKDFPKLETDNDDTNRIQRALNYCRDVNKNLSLDGTSYTVRNLNLPVGVSIYGNGSVLKKPNLSAPPYNEDVNSMKWVRMITISYEGEEDSLNTIISDLNFDGSCWEMWDEPSYEQEQASIIIASGSNNKKGKLNLTIQNCTFKDNVSDGIHIVNNVNVDITNCRSKDCFRGGLTITGGNSIVNVNGFIFNSELLNDGIDIEIDSIGYNSNWATIVNLNNVTLDNDFDVWLNKANCIVNVNNSTLKKFYYIMCENKTSSINFSNSYIECEGNGYPNSNVMCKNGKINFNNCDFKLNDINNNSCNVISIHCISDKGTGKITWDKCSFGVINPISGKKYNGISKTNYDLNNNTLVFNDCTFDDTLSIGLDLRCNKLILKNIFINASDYLFVGGSGNWNRLNLYLDGLVFLNDSCKLMKTDYANNKINFNNITLYNINNSIMEGSYLYNVGEANSGNYYAGTKTIYDNDTNVPDITNYKAVTGVVGDIFIYDYSSSSENKGKRFKCTKTNDQTGKSVWEIIS